MKAFKNILRIAVIGGGSHSRGNHLPALVRYASNYPEAVELTAFCDRRREVAEEVSRKFGFLQAYTDVEEMLAAGNLDGCISITPLAATANVARQIIAAGVPLLMEKPPGSTPEEAREICRLAASRNVRVMVSMNRRFDPALCAASSWRADRPLEYVRATMLRNERTESHFFVETAIHSLDAIRWIAGDVIGYSLNARQVEGVWWYRVRLEFESGAAGMLEVMPSCGNRAEFYEMFGAGYRVTASVGEVDSGEFAAWEGGQIVERDEPARGMPPFVKNGTFAETVEFLGALRENRVPHPTPEDVWQSVDLCHRLQHEAVEILAQPAGEGAA